MLLGRPIVEKSPGFSLEAEADFLRSGNSQMNEFGSTSTLSGALRQL